MRAIGPCSWLSAAACAQTRNGHNWSDRYPGIIAAARKLSCRSAILDGEVIVQDARGVSDFEALHVALRSRPSRLIFYAFDLFDRPLVERRAKLLELVRHDQESPIQFSEEFIGDAAAFFRACAAHELEGRSARGFRGKARQTETGLLRLAGSLHRKNPGVSVLN
jgi:bifunctional non-homologous end joining protein LigD